MSDELWTRLQATLSSSFRLSKGQIFGESHFPALEELKTAQMKLAEAWTSSKSDPAGPTQADSVQPAAKKTNVPLMSIPFTTDNDSQTPKESVDDVKAAVKLVKARRLENEQHFEQAEQFLNKLKEKLGDVTRGMDLVHAENEKIWIVDSDQHSHSRTETQSPAPETKLAQASSPEDGDKDDSEKTADGTEPATSSGPPQSPSAPAADGRPDDAAGL